MNILKKLIFPSWVVAFFCIFALISLEGAWDPPVTISDTTSTQPDIGISDAGYAIAIWQEFDGVNTNIQSATRPLGGSWSFPAITTTISSSPGFDPGTKPRIAVDPAGNAVAVWDEFNDVSSTYKVRGATLPFGGTWSSPVDLSISNSAGGSAPEVSVDPAGNAVAIWAMNTNNVIQSATFLFGTGWLPTVNVIAPSAQTPFTPQVAIDASGNAIAVWAKFTGVPGDIVIQSSRLPFGGTWSLSPVPISNSTDANRDPQIAVNNVGNAVAVWVNSTTHRIQAATFSGGVWASFQNVSPAGADLPSRPQVAFFPNGNAMAIWDQPTGASDTIRVSTLTFGGSWSTPPVDISPFGENSLFPQIGIDAAGNVIAVWSNVDSDTIQAARLPFGGSWSSPVDDLSPLGDFSLFPEIAVAPSGDAVVDWENDSLGVIQSSGFVPPPPSPPSFFIGSVIKNKFLNKTECCLRATFGPSTDPDVVLYRIYRNSQVIAEIPATGPFTINLPVPCANADYSITAVRSNGTESSHVPLTS